MNSILMYLVAIFCVLFTVGGSVFGYNPDYALPIAVLLLSVLGTLGFERRMWKENKVSRVKRWVSHLVVAAFTSSIWVLFMRG